MAGVDVPSPRTTVVVVTWLRPGLLHSCLSSLAAQTEPHHVLVVDNGGDDATAEVLDGHPAVQVIRPGRNTGFAGAVALAMDEVRTPFTALLNNDAVAGRGWLAALLEDLDAHPRAAAVTSRMVLQGRGGVLNNTGVLLSPDGRGSDRGAGDPPDRWLEAGEVFGFSGGAALLRTDAVLAVGGFPAPFFLYYEDTDTSWRLRRAGWSIRYQPRAVVEHVHAASTDVRSPLFAFHNERNRLLMLVRCGPGRTAVGQLLRFCLTSASLLARRLTGRPITATPAFDQGLRLRVLRSYLRWLPWALAARRSVRRSASTRPSPAHPSA